MSYTLARIQTKDGKPFHVHKGKETRRTIPTSTPRKA